MSYRTSREMLWHIVSTTDEFFRKDGLADKPKEELVDFIVKIYDLIWEQLNESEQ